MKLLLGECYLRRAGRSWIYSRQNWARWDLPHISSGNKWPETMQAWRPGLSVALNFAWRQSSTLRWTMGFRWIRHFGLLGLFNWKIQWASTERLTPGKSKQRSSAPLEVGRRQWPLARLWDLQQKSEHLVRQMLNGIWSQKESPEFENYSCKLLDVCE